MDAIEQEGSESSSPEDGEGGSDQLTGMKAEQCWKWCFGAKGGEIEREESAPDEGHGSSDAEEPRQLVSFGNSSRIVETAIDDVGRTHS